MTKLYFAELSLKGPRLGAPNPFPALRRSLESKISWRTDETDGLFMEYGILDTQMPYTMLDSYAGAAEYQTFQTVVLENEFLKAEFIPALGGRLWSLYDKEARRDLVYRNSELRIGNLAIRNAWFAGGIEWNFGRRGHDALTCLPLFTAVTKDDDGNPVLRMYEYSRDRNATRQMDFSLPSGSKYLFTRVRIVNPNRYVIPMYWWSNIAVAETPGERIIVPASSTFSNTYVSETEHSMCKVPLPFNEGIDCTYPVNYWSVKDHFFNIPENERKFELAVFEDGYGLSYCSTARLKGRKLFVWGQCPGGQHWQQRLAPAGNYLEIQGGLASSQLEHLPMPPLTAWEWLEAYGAVRMDYKDVAGEWNHAVDAAKKAIPPQAFFDAEFAKNKFVKKPADLISNGSGWGSLENRRRLKDGLGPLSGHLDFGVPGEEQAPWQALLEKNSMSDAEPVSFMVQDEWFERLKKAEPSKAVCYHLAVNWYFREDYERALKLVDGSDAWSLHLKGNILRASGKLKESIPVFAEALRLNRALTVEVFKVMLESGEYRTLLDSFADAEPVPMARFLKASALAHLGELDEAQGILEDMEAPPDIREGEISLSDLYIYIQCERARRNGTVLKPEEVDVPFRFDFRMKQARKTEKIC